MDIDNTPRVQWTRFSDGHFISNSKVLLLRFTDNSVAVGYIDDYYNCDCKDIRYALVDEGGNKFPKPTMITHYAYLCLPLG